MISHILGCGMTVEDDKGAIINAWMAGSTLAQTVRDRRSLGFDRIWKK